MKHHLFIALALASMLHAGAETPKKTTQVTGHAVSKTGHSNEKGAGEKAGSGEISRLFHAIHRSGGQVGRLFDPSASYRRGAAVRNTSAP
jgi:hypothetical protein